LFDAFSAKGAGCKSLGQRPRYDGIVVKALKARNEYWSSKWRIMSRLQRLGIADGLPGALPQAAALRTFGADA